LAMYFLWECKLRKNLPTLQALKKFFIWEISILRSINKQLDLDCTAFGINNLQA
jgi:hypothetical protein